MSKSRADKRITVIGRASVCPGCSGFCELAAERSSLFPGIKGGKEGWGLQWLLTKASEFAFHLQGGSWNSLPLEGLLTPPGNGTVIAAFNSSWAPEPAAWVGRMAAVLKAKDSHLYFTLSLELPGTYT